MFVESLYSHVEQELEQIKQACYKRVIDNKCMSHQSSAFNRRRFCFEIHVMLHACRPGPHMPIPILGILQYRISKTIPKFILNSHHAKFRLLITCYSVAELFSTCVQSTIAITPWSVLNFKTDSDSEFRRLLSPASGVCLKSIQISIEE